MSKSDQYHLAFAKRHDGKSIEYIVHALGSAEEYTIARKIQVMHIPECEGLIKEIQSAQDGDYFEEYFSIDRSAASDDDKIELSTTHITIDTVVVPLQDMKEILQEWLAFVKGK